VRGRKEDTLTASLSIQAWLRRCSKKKVVAKNKVEITRFMARLLIWVFSASRLKRMAKKLLKKLEEKRSIMELTAKLEGFAAPLFLLTVCMCV